MEDKVISNQHRRPILYNGSRQSIPATCSWTSVPAMVYTNCCISYASGNHNHDGDNPLAHDRKSLPDCREVSSLLIQVTCITYFSIRMWELDTHCRRWEQDQSTRDHVLQEAVRISYKEHKTNEYVRNKTTALVSSQEPRIYGVRPSLWPRRASLYNDVCVNAHLVLITLQSSRCHGKLQSERRSVDEKQQSVLFHDTQEQQKVPVWTPCITSAVLTRTWLLYVIRPSMQSGLFLKLDCSKLQRRSH